MILLKSDDFKKAFYKRNFLKNVQFIQQCNNFIG